MDGNTQCGVAPTVQPKENRPQISLQPISTLAKAQLLLLLTHATIVNDFTRYRRGPLPLTNRGVVRFIPQE